MRASPREDRWQVSWCTTRFRPQTRAARASSGAGWQFDQAFPGTDYHLTQIDERTGGAVTNGEPGRTGPRAYFDVDDIEAGAARVRELGGEASERMPVPGMGWFVTCTDPQGNEFGLWQHDRSAPTPEM